MQLPVLTRWLVAGPLLGLLAGLGQPALAQTPSAAQLRARHAPAGTTRLATDDNAHPRLDAELRRVLAQAAAVGQRGHRPTPADLRLASPGLHFGTGPTGATVLARVMARDVAALLPVLRGQGFVASSSYPQLHFVEGMLPVSELAGAEALARQGLLGVVAAWEPESNGGAVTSQADYVLEAARARATLPRRITGAGVNVGVLSDSYNYLGGAAAGMASGDLPQVNVLSDGGSTDEGRGMCELIYDLAPGVGLAFSTANGGEGVFAQHIRDLADPTKGNCRVIVDDVRYFAEPMFQDGVIAQAITDVVNNQGAVYFSSAGNYSDKSYENTAPQFVTQPGGARYLNFDVSGASSDITQRVSIANGGTFRPFMQWSDPFYTVGGVQTDLDLYLVAVRNGVSADTVLRATTRNITTSYPSENLYYTNNTTTSTTTTFDFVVRLRIGQAPSVVKYINYGNSLPSEWLTSSSTSTGHPASAEGFAVAAVPYYNQRVAESFTSKGGALRILFSPTGTPLATPAIRQKPNLASVDGANTTFFGGSDYETDGFPNFFGTSAAAPHAAAVAALLRAGEPALTPAQVYARLVGSARLLANTATDPLTGPGLVDAYTALYGATAPATPPVAEDLENRALPVNWRVDGTGAARATVSSQAPASGSQSLVLDAYPYITSRSSLNEATLFLQGAAAAPNLQLSFRTRRFVNETDEAMPVQFTGSSNTDGVALSVDSGQSWYRVADLTGPNATTSFQTRTVNLSQFAAANSLTLGSDVRLRFQQYGRGGSTNPVAASRTGRVFDDIVVTTAASPAPVPLYAYSPQPTSGCPGLQVQFADTSLYRPVSFVWTFPGGTPGSSTARNPVVTYNAPGRYGVTLAVTNSTGTVARTDTGVVVVRPARTYLPTLTENFDAATTLPAGWSLATPGAYAWVVVPGIIGRSGAASNALRAPFAADAVIGEYPTVYTPAVSLNSAAPTLRFDLAYAPYSPLVGVPTTRNDSLIVRVADACTGAVLGRPYAKSALNTLPTLPEQTTDYVPAAGADWRQELVDLTPYAGRNVVLQFVGRNGHGNYLYLDNVAVGNNLLGLTAAAGTVGLEAWPNPTPAGTSLTLRLPAFSGEVKVQLVDNLGRVVWQQQLMQAGAALERTLALPFAPGLYNLVYTPAGGTPAARRIAVQ